MDQKINETQFDEHDAYLYLCDVKRTTIITIHRLVHNPELCDALKALSGIESRIELAQKYAGYTVDQFLDKYLTDNL